jgi:hypothetical protein
MKWTKLILWLCALLGAAQAAEWNQYLYLGRGDYWRQRIPLVVTNAGSAAAEGAAVDLRIGAGAGEVALAGASADALRVCDAGGNELLWALRDADGEGVRKGTIPSGSTLTVPVVCAAQSGTLLYLYFDNPAAWPVPDFLDAASGLRNGGMESGSGAAPTGWQHDEADATHRASWVTEQPHSGAKCLKTVVATGAEPTWIATRQQHIRITGGARYLFHAWVRAENVAGNAGWYLHIGCATNSQMLNPMVNGGKGSYGWKEVRTEFTAPATADRAVIGTVLRGTGTAWFDDAALERLDPGTLRATALPPERMHAIAETGADAAWPTAGDFATAAYRFPLRVLNLGAQPVEGGFISADLGAALARLNGRIDPERLSVREGGQPVPFHRIGQTLLFPGGVAPRTRKTFAVYFAPGTGRNAAQESAVRNYAANPALPGGETRESVAGVVRAEYARLLASGANLVRNPDFESGDGVPSDWHGAENKRDDRVQMNGATPGLFGNRCAQMLVSTNAGLAWRGWKQSIAVKPGRTYLVASWLKCRGLAGDSLQIHAHVLDAHGKICREDGFRSIGPALSGTHDWTLLQGLLTLARDAAHLEIHLTTQATGAAWHDGVVVTEVTPAQPAALESRPAAEATQPVAWPVNAIVKVFRDDVPPAQIPVARLTAARGEREPLQVALRSPRAIAGVNVIADAPRGSWGKRLPAPDIGVVGYVPVDHASNYFQTDSPAWQRKFPTRAGACDGWCDLWPDPILPKTVFDLAAHQTQPAWLTIHVPVDAKSGDYRGTVRFEAGGKTIAELPYTIHVWDFALPAEQHVKAIYDARGTGPRWQQPGMTADEGRREMWKFMAERRLCPDGIKPEPKLNFRNGQVEADFAEFDKAAAYYLEELKLQHFYTPHLFYGFGWGHPPHKLSGEEPFPGAWPFTDADHRVLRPEYKHAYQECLKVFWAHLKEKGWDKKCTLYISDEPYDTKQPIREQMIALCAMIREVDPAIPIYCSTWHHQPAWDGSLTVWGVGHYGIVPVEKLDALRQGGAKLWWTTDGQMCLDTPLCAVERLLPHYCFKFGAEAYEFWGVDWLTYDPYEFGWHSYIHQSGEPGKTTWVRYPNGDGYLVYPGAKFGQRAPVSTVRLEQAGEGCEDYEYLWLLRDRIAAAQQAGRDTAAAARVLAEAQELVTIPNASGRYSTRILPDPDAVLRVKERVAQAIEALR